MNFLSLKYFTVVAEELNITRAAERLFITQQCLSTQIKKLESELGTQLFYRTPKLTLTYSGSVVLNYAAQILDTKRQLDSALDDINMRERGKLSIGISHTRGRVILPDIIPEFNKKYPFVEISLFEGNSKELEEALKHGRVDVIISFAPILIDYIVTTELCTEKLFLAVPKSITRKLFGEKSEELAQSFLKGVELAAYKEAPFILLKKGNRIRSVVDEYFLENAISPYVVVELENIETTLSFALKEMGVTVYPETLLKNIYPYTSTADYRNIDFFPCNSLPSNHLVIGHHNSRYLSKAAANFIEMAKCAFY